MIDACILGHSQVRTKREFLEHTADAQLQGARGRIVPLRLARHGHLPATLDQRSGQYIHQRGFSGPIVADKTDAFPIYHSEIDAVQSTNDTELLFDAVQTDDGDIRHYFMLALIAASASVWLYSLLATPPLGMVFSAASKFSWVKAR